MEWLDIMITWKEALPRGHCQCQAVTHVRVAVPSKAVVYEQMVSHGKDLRQEIVSQE